MDTNQTITLPFGTPAEVEKAGWLLAALATSGVHFDADKDGTNWLIIQIRS